MGQKKYANGFDVTVHPDVLDEPNHWLKSRLVFVCSMSDLFHDKVSLTFIQRVFDVMENNPDHTFQVLTKRSERLVKIADKLPWPNNIWLGVTVENSKYISRIDDLKKTPAKVKFVSAEPLLSEIPTLDLRDIHWVIVGGESGPGARPIETEWVTDIRDQCAKANVAFFFKQWGGLNKKKAGRELDGKLYSELPLDTLNV